MVAALYKKSYIPDWTHGKVFSYYEPASWNSFCFTSRPTRIRLMADNLVHLWGGAGGEGGGLGIRSAQRDGAAGGGGGEGGDLLGDRARDNLSFSFCISKVCQLDSLKRFQLWQVVQRFGQ